MRWVPIQVILWGETETSSETRMFVNIKRSDKGDRAFRTQEYRCRESPDQLLLVNLVC